MQVQGKISQWMDDQGYGFIETDGQGDRVFVHIKAFTDRHRRPVTGDLVAYRLTKDKQGRPRAEEVTFVGDPPVVPQSPSAEAAESRPGRFRRRKTRRMSPSSLLLAVFFLGLIIVAVTGDASWWVVVYFAAISLVTFVVYAVDKSAAQKDRWRVPENTLHLLGLLGGWPGGLAAQIWLRHKSSKLWFQVVFWLTVAVNVAVLVGLKVAL